MVHSRSVLLHGTVCLALALTACSGQSGRDAKKKPVPQVGFVVMKPTSAPIATSLSARVVASETSEVRPQITGLIQKRLFEEGGMVHAGQPLFQIDPSLYRAAVNQAQANVQSAQATAEAASAKAERYKPLAALEAVAKQDYTDALAAARQARASIAQNGAQLETARVNLRFTTVPAPISGRIGRSLYTVGALVSAGQANPLAVIQKLDPVYVDMQQSSADLLALRRTLAQSGVQRGSAVVRLTLEDGSDYGRTGTVRFSEVTVNQATGTVTLRASFPNPDGILLPGMFVQAHFDSAVESNVYLVPQEAMQRDLGGDGFVFLVGPDKKVIRRPVKTARTSGANWVVVEGLKPGDKVITQGTNGLKKDMPVKPVPASTPEKIEPRKPGERGGPAGAKQGG